MGLAQTWPYLLALLLASGLDIASNLMLKKSQGFTRKTYGLAAMLLMIGALSCLAYIVTGLPLAVAWALWTSLGVLGPALGGWLLFGQKISGLPLDFRTRVKANRFKMFECWLPASFRQKLQVVGKSATDNC